MKRVVTILTVLALPYVVTAESIDGTLAVDAPNTQAQAFAPTQGSTNGQLSASGSSCNTGAKDVAQPTTLPASTNGGYSFLEGPFVGLEASGVLSSKADGLSTGGLSFGLRFGAQNTEWRTMAILESFSSSDDYNNYVRALLQLDYYFLGMDNLMIDSYAIRPYAGLNAGGISLDTQSDNIKSLTYGAQVGATMNITNQIDLDVGYRYNLSSSDRIDHTTGLAVGVHYKY